MENRSLWRGKRRDVGAWVYGPLIFRKGLPFISVPIFKNEPGVIQKSHVYSVRTETVGQCIGERDKCGKLLYEGDVVGTIFGTGSIHYDRGIFVLNTEPFNEDPSFYLPTWGLIKKLGDIHTMNSKWRRDNG